MNKKKIIIFGTSFHSKVIASEVLQLSEFNFLGHIDVTKLINGKIIKKKPTNYKVLGEIKDLTKIIDNKTFGVIGVGSNFIREKIALEVDSILKNFSWEKIISKNSKICPDVKIGNGSVIISGSIINSGTTIRNHCLINTGSIIDHDNYFDDFSSSGPGVTTGGNVKVGKFSYLGIGSTIKHQIDVGENTVIGGQSFVNKNCDSNSIYYGVAAKKIRARQKEEKYL